MKRIAVDKQKNFEHMANETQLEWLADMYHKQGDYEAAIATLELLLKLKKQPVEDTRRSA